MDILETAAYDRRQRRNTSCALLLTLLPFFASVALYFYMLTPESPASIMAAGVKTAPTLLLAAAVLSWNGAQSVVGVAGGLLLSAVGDCCLIWPELLVHGMGAFAMAHLVYSLTFLSSRYPTYSSSTATGFLFVIMLTLGGGAYMYMYPFLKKAPDADLIVPGVGVYTALISLMGALAIRTRHVVTLLGSLIFIVSDVTLAFQMFKVVPEMEHGQAVVMVTYYLAQLLIAVGDIKAQKTQDDFAKWKRS